MSPLAHPKGKTPSRSCNLRKGVFFLVLTVRFSFVQPLSLASLDSSPSRGASGGEENFELGRKTLRNAKASPR